jgi:hypothetical protein
MATDQPTDASADDHQAAAAPLPGAAGSVFAITVPATTVTLDAQRQATVPFTVSNTSGRALRGGALLVTPDAAVKPWLTIVGDVDRDFPVGATQQYPVKVVAPTSATPGSYSFHLDVRDLANPDEDYAQGPSVAFQVTQAPPPPPPTRFPWWIIAVIVAVVVVVGLILFFVLRNTTTTTTTPPTPTPTPTAAGVTAPGVIGQLAPNAEATIQTSGLQVGTVTTRIIAVGTAGVVVAQTPVPAAVVPRNSSVNLVVTGPPRVIIDQPTATIAAGQALNLETGAPGPASATSVSYSTAPGKVGDTAVVDWVIQPPNGARFAVLPAGTAANHDTCVSALNAVQPSTAPLQTATIPAGTAYCIQQSNGNVSLLQVTSAKTQQLQAAPIAADTSLHVALTTWDQ